MISEERIKELAEQFWEELWPTRKQTALQGLEQLIRTVAAEARQDTIKELEDAGRLIPI